MFNFYFAMLLGVSACPLIEDDEEPPELLCDERADGALITFQIVDETFSVWVTNEEFAEEAKVYIGTQSRIPAFGDLVEGTDCDPQWSWHVDPDDMSWADLTIELCDGLPSFIEDDLEYWLEGVDSYCPWGAEVLVVDDRFE
jgi:hypothetical protein